VAYYGGLSLWSLDETRALDSLVARIYRQISNNMRSSQAEALFQPCTMGGYVFPRLSNVNQDQKLSLLARVHEHGAHYTRCAAGAIERRGTTEAMGRAPCLNRIRPGYWISSIVEYTLEGGTILMQETACNIPPRDKLTDPSWRAGLTPSQRKHLATEDIFSSADLVTLDPEFRLTTFEEQSPPSRTG